MAKGKLGAAKGVDRAKLLDQIIEGYEKLGNSTKKQGEQVAAWSKEIITLDPDNEAGSEVKYEFPMKIDRGGGTRQGGRARRGQGAVEQGTGGQGRSGGNAAGRLHGPGPGICETEGKFVDLVAALESCQGSCPGKSERRAKIDSLIEQFGKVAEEQETVAQAGSRTAQRRRALTAPSSWTS